MIMMKTLTRKTHNFNLLALSAVFFLWPFLKNQNFFLLSVSENQDFQVFVKIGTLALILLWLAVIFLWIEHLFYLSNIISLLLLYLLVLVEIYGVLAIFTGVHTIKNTYSNVQKLQILSIYIPGYQTYLRNKKTDYQKPIWRYKESELSRFLIALGFLISHYLGFFLFSLLVLRLLLLWLEIDMIPHSQKAQINKRYTINPEETFVVIFSKLFSFRSKKNGQWLWFQKIKELYTKRYSFSNPKVWGGAIIVCWVFILFFYLNWNCLGIIIGMSLIVLRSVITFLVTWKFTSWIPSFAAV